MTECVINNNVIRYDEKSFRFEESKYGDHLRYIGTGGIVPQPVPLLSMYSMFCGSKVSELDLSSWDTSEVTTMYECFCDCVNLEKIVGIENFNTKKCTSFTAAFLCCYKLKNLDLSNWDVSSAKTFDCMFSENYSLESIDISTWDLSSTEEICWMFDTCRALKHLDVSKWDVSNVKDIRMFVHGCTSLTKIEVDNWNIASVELLTGAFANCPCFNPKQVENWGLENYKQEQLTLHEDFRGDMKLF